MEDLSLKYQIKTDKQHVLDNPDTYTGSMEKSTINTYVLENNKIVLKSVDIISGVYKLFDEVITNAIDHKTRMKDTDNKVSYIKIYIKDDIITIQNDGSGIDIEKHPIENIWIPEMIFGHLRTSTNYNKEEKKIVGGKNGFGVKLIFIWSEWAEIETVDSKRKLIYTQTFRDNLNIIEEPIIKKYSKKSYTKISFKLDFKRLKYSLDKDIMSVFDRRIMDIAMLAGIKVSYNDEVIKLNNFKQYVEMYTEDEKVYELANERWEYIVSINDETQQVSFVNGIFTNKGGKHVDYITNQINRKLIAYIKLKKKIDVKPSSIKYSLYLRCDIENPSFDSQIKDYLNTNSSNFGSTCEVSDKFIEKIAKLGIMANACALNELKDNKLAKKTDGSKTKRIKGIPKLIDANFAGTAKSNECAIILCEGDSAKAGIRSGLTEKDMDTIGIYPLKGKVLNVRGIPVSKISDNKEISELKQILGLETGKVYENTNSLRYGKILILCDADYDGYHIKGLIINLFESLWPSLFKLNGFIGYINTPIVKIKDGTVFYNEGDFNKWKESRNVKKGDVKYYKGLGTSTAEEFKGYFKNKREIFYKCKKQSSELIDMAFNKKRAFDRKEWIRNFDSKAFIDTNKTEVSYSEFINKELIHFSSYSCDRALPNIMDGLKTGQRKVIFTAFDKNVTKEIKVARFSGAVSERSEYHHGEASLNGTIINLAQNFVGSNNINLLVPAGQFGTRDCGPTEHASERYIFTYLNPITRTIFNIYDDAILTYLDSESISVEPEFYVPILPMILINGSIGLGTGFSTNIMCYSISDIIQYIKNSLNNIDNIKIRPDYRGYKGDIVKLSNTQYLFKGKYEIINDKKIVITELPIEVWTEDYKIFLEKLLDSENDSKPILKSYTNSSADENIKITLIFNNSITELVDTVVEHGCNGLEKLLQLYTTKSNTNMHMFDENRKLIKYDTVEEIADHYIKVRLIYYTKRKDYLIAKLKSELVLLSNKSKFITEILNNTIDMRKKQNLEVVKILEDKNYDKIDDSYKYLTALPMYSVTEENVRKILNMEEEKLKELEIIQNINEKQMWLNDLELI